MNGISVMTFVQAPCGNGYQSSCNGRYRQDPVQDKRITISSRCFSAGKDAGRAGECTGSRVRDTREGHFQRPSAEKAVPVPSGTAGSSLLGKRSSSDRRTAGQASAGALRFLVLALVFAGMLAGFRMMTRASDLEKEQTWKYYTTVTIGHGEDLTDIIYRYCDREEYADADEYLQEVCSINSLPYRRGEVPDLCAGTKIVVPYFSTEYK